MIVYHKIFSVGYFLTSKFLKRLNSLNYFKIKKQIAQEIHWFLLKGCLMLVIRMFIPTFIYFYIYLYKHGNTGRYGREGVQSIHEPHKLTSGFAEWSPSQTKLSPSLMLRLTNSVSRTTIRYYVA